MDYTIVGYNQDYINKQVDLIWDVSGKWKYPYRTSYDALRKAYTSDKFDPTTRYYAFSGDEMVGYIAADVIRNTEKGDYGTVRLPVVKNDDREIAKALMNKATERFKELGIRRLRAPAGVGFGNTIELAEEYGFEKKSLLFKRTRMHIDELKISGDTLNVANFEDSLLGLLKDIYETSMGMSKEEGLYWYNFALSNRNRKENEYGPSRISWKMTTNSEGITGFSYMHRSDYDPSYGGVAPFWSRDPKNIETIIDTHLSAHVETLKPAGLEYVGTFIIDELLKFEDLYNKFGFEFDGTYSYEKIL